MEPPVLLKLFILIDWCVKMTLHAPWVCHILPALSPSLGSMPLTFSPHFSLLSFLGHTPPVGLGFLHGICTTGWVDTIHTHAHTQFWHSCSSPCCFLRLHHCSSFSPSLCLFLYLRSVVCLCVFVFSLSCPHSFCASPTSHPPSPSSPFSLCRSLLIKMF